MLIEAAYIALAFVLLMFFGYAAFMYWFKNYNW